MARWTITLLIIWSLHGVIGCRSSQSNQGIDAGKVQQLSPDDRVNDRIAISEGVSRDFSRRRVQQEILLHAALYRAAHQTNVGDQEQHFVLEPVEESDPPDLGAEPEGFRQRVMDALSDLNVSLAWVQDTWRTGELGDTMGVGDVFPGTQERATRLRIKIIKRIEDQATVHAEIGDTTAGGRSSRQGVIATWDGIRWNIQRDRARVVW